MNFDLKQQVASEFPLITKQLKFLCHINSGSYNLDGLQQMLKALTALFSPIADDIQIISALPSQQINMHGQTYEQACGDMLFMRKRPKCMRRILLTGHMDTVFGLDSPFQSIMTLDENRWNGPGVSDMKGGLLVMLHALTHFEQSAHAESLGWDILINADEEIGSLSSRDFIDEIAGHYQAGLVYEPAMNDLGTLAKNRKGSGKLTLVAQGKTAHAGRAFHDGCNAIAYLSEALVAIHKLNFPPKGVTINIGKILGGEALNQVPDTAVAKLDIRIEQPEEEFWVREQLNNIIQNLTREGYQLNVHGDFARPVKKVDSKTVKLFERIKTVGRQIGVNIDWMDNGGCCDGNNIAAHGVPVIDTLGVRGGAIHSPNEYILLDSLTERTILSTLLLEDLAQGGLEEIQS